MQTLHIVDSHTGGEPTRVVIAGGPPLSGDSVYAQRETLHQEYDWLRSACLSEPRGHAAMVGALLCESQYEDCISGVIFFNNVGYLGGCLHGTMGVVRTLVHLGRIPSQGSCGIETPVGRVTATIDEHGLISVRNIRSYRYASSVQVDVPKFGTVFGDVAWSGNWFFLLENSSGIPLDVAYADDLTEFSVAVRESLIAQGITGADGLEVDHVEIFGSPSKPQISDSKNFVLCPGNVYDRSPCGTGTSAKMACLYADGQLKPGQIWRQAGILDTIFEGSIKAAPDGGVIPTVNGHAFVNGSAELLLDPADPFRYGIPAPDLSKICAD